jgi:hypothetical protein
MVCTIASAALRPPPTDSPTRVRSNRPLFASKYTSFTTSQRSALQMKVGARLKHMSTASSALAVSFREATDYAVDVGAYYMKI